MNTIKKDIARTLHSLSFGFVVYISNPQNPLKHLVITGFAGKRH